MNIYDIAEVNKEGDAEKLENAEKILLDIFASHNDDVERWIMTLIHKMCEIESGIEPENIINRILSNLSDESIHYPFTLLHDSQGTRIAGDLPPHIELKIKSKDNE